MDKKRPLLREEKVFCGASDESLNGRHEAMRNGIG